MKLPLLLASFLYKNRKLNLPGIGRFSIDAKAVMPDPAAKNADLPLPINFTNASIFQPDDDLINYIREHTGKMKPLAASDLDSFLTLGREMINIGKPFFLEGIGTLSKNKEGKYDFEPDTQLAGDAERKDESSRPEPVEKVESKAKPERSAPVSENKNKSKKIQEKETPAGTGPRRMGLVVVAIIAAIAIIAIGGYLLYNKNKPADEENQAVVVLDSAKPAPVDTVQKQNLLKDSTALNQTSTGDSARYKFVILQTPNKARALRRYNQLLSLDIKANINTKDTTNYQVYFSLPATAKDTLHIKDSLQREFAHAVIIQQ